jgi:hypothetical protein
MAQSLPAADLHLALDVLRHLAAQVTLDLERGLDVVADAGDLVVGEVAHPGVGADFEGGADLLAAGAPDAVDVGERDLQPLLAGDVYAGDACHQSPLALALLVARVGADDLHAAMPADHLALLTDSLDAGSNLHDDPVTCSDR